MSNEIEVLDLFLTLLASGTGAWLSIRYLPMQAKKAEYQWRQRLDSEQQVKSSLCKIDFISHHYLASEYGERFSLSGKSLIDTQKEVISMLREFHFRAFEWMPYLDKKYLDTVRGFLTSSQRALDAHRENCVNRHISDQDDVDGLYNDLLMALSEAVGDALPKIGLTSIQMAGEDG
ncbi:hypothetical protein AB4876_05590 [Zhongshania guokunii]|uniref:Uncharacterized protein n=1 Tax=Zhongshania guokunii TaxID=641783 RepID=A0ABV3U375_9GAMM